MSSFVHLHCHSEYSLLDGAIRVGELSKKAASLGMPAVALTDHGNMFGAIGFYQSALKAGVKPIIGCELYVAPGSMRERAASSARDAAYHFTVLAASDAGYRNLVKLISSAHLEGFYYKPRVDKELLATHSEGLIGLSGCLKGEVNMLFQAGRPADAEKAACQYRDIFGADSFFVEIHDHGLDAQRRCNPELVRLARKLDLGLVAANDVHFLERSHHEAHDVMICIGTGSMVMDEKRMRYVPELYFKTAEEMRSLFAELPEACDNTLRIAERCDLKLEFGKPKYPDYFPPEGMTREGYLSHLCWEGLRIRYGERAESDKEVRDRLEYELGVIQKTGFISYFLIVWDFINYAKQRGIPVGPGRGSAAGSLIAYVLGITDIDPLRFGLIFERFLNPERISPPDIDVDFCMDRRGEVIDYVREKYGERAVSQIVTFGTMGAKSVLRDVGRVLGWSYGDADRVAKMIPNELNISLESAIAKNPELRQAVEENPSTKQLWDYALVLEGLSRNTGIHAAGVVIGDRPLDEYIPLCRGKDDEVITQYAMNPLTELGMLKMDFLGLKTLTVIHDAVQLIHRKEPDFDLSKVSLDDPETFALLNRADVVGVFQIDGGMMSWCKQFDFRSVDDIIALNALYRPGPMQFIPDYIDRKKGVKKIVYAHPLLEKVCSDTYGIIVYQEQVQRAANVLAGYSLGEADLLRRAMGKKDREKMDKERTRFVEGCGRVNDIDPKQADAIFDFIARFAEYGFNKSHSAAYGVVSYQTAYLKAHFPVEFMAGLMSNDMGDTDKISAFITECRRMEIKILPPDINESFLKFSPAASEDSKAIRFGLAAVKNVGEGAMRSAIEEREKAGKFKTLADFCSRLDSRTVNRKIIESLIKCGAFDSFGKSRAELFTEIDGAMSSAAAAQRDRMSGQVSLFGSEPAEESRGPGSGIPVEPWSVTETLSYEKELLGFYVTGHPLDAYAGHFDNGKLATILSVREMETPVTVKLAGLISSMEKKFSKRDGKPFAMLILEDFTGSLEIVAWDEAFAKFSPLLLPGTVVTVSARITRKEDMVRASANQFAALKPKVSVRPVRLRLARQKLQEEDLGLILAEVRNFPGKRPLLIEIVSEDGRSFEFQAGEEFAVGDERSFLQSLSRYAVQKAA